MKITTIVGGPAPRCNITTIVGGGGGPRCNITTIMGGPRGVTLPRLWPLPPEVYLCLFEC